MKLPNNPRVLAATYNPVSDTKMISFLVDFPTVLLAELRTHRILTQGSLYEHSELIDFNLSANSARAIPTNKYLDKVLNNPFIPIWTKQQKGMSGDLLEKSNSLNSTQLWNNILEHFENNDIKEAYEDLLKEGAHKQNANRLLAPFAYTTCILSGTEWSNFFELRCPQYEFFDERNNTTMYFKSKREFVKYFNNKELYIDSQTVNSEEFWQSINKSSAQPEFQVIAEMLYDLYQEADWEESKYHIPFKDEIVDLYKDKLIELRKDKFDNVLYSDIMKISASMCAKLSYNTQDNDDTLEKHLERANMLIEHKHQEPFSHQAISMNDYEYKVFIKSMLKGKDKKIIKEHGWCYNLRGFISQRYNLENY